MFQDCHSKYFLFCHFTCSLFRKFSLLGPNEGVPMLRWEVGMSFCLFLQLYMRNIYNTDKSGTTPISPELCVRPGTLKSFATYLWDNFAVTR